MGPGPLNVGTTRRTCSQWGLCPPPLGPLKALPVINVRVGYFSSCCGRNDLTEEGSGLVHNLREYIPTWGKRHMASVTPGVAHSHRGA